MTDHSDIDDPVRAFDDLRREVSLGLRAIQGLTAEHRDVPDYSKTLATIDARLDGLAASLNGIARAQAMEMTPDLLGREIVTASERVRAADSEMLRAAGQSIGTATHNLRELADQARSATAQWIELKRAAAIGFCGGVLLSMLLFAAFS